MKHFQWFVVAGLVCFAFAASADHVPTGVWAQTSASAGDCATCEITVTQVTPNILRIDSNTEWVGYAYYDARSDAYQGALEWRAGQGGDWGNQVFLFDLSYQNGTLTLRARSVYNSFSATYRYL